MSAVGIRLEGISKQFAHRVKGVVYAVQDVSLDVRPGELLTLLGPSGCGKTTTLRMIAGFERPDTGRIFLADEDVTELMANQRHMGFVFQNYALFPHLTIFENVAYGLRVQGMAASEITKAVAEVLEMVGLAGYDRQFPQQLSGGEQQRVAVARAVVIRPRVLLFDEPLSNLDAKLRVHMRGELRDLQKRLSVTAVYVTHDQEEAMAISDRIVVMHQGRIVQEGTADQLYHRPASAFVAQFIGRTNLLPGRVVGEGPGGLDVELDGLPAHVKLQGSRLPAGQPVQLVFRPEAIDLEAADGPEGLPGVVVSRAFLGEKVEYRVRVGEQLLQVVGYNPRKVFAAAQAVRVVLPHADVPIVTGGPA